MPRSEQPTALANRSFVSAVAVQNATPPPPRSFVLTRPHWRNRDRRDLSPARTLVASTPSDQPAVAALLRRAAMLTYEANELEDTIDVLAHNNHALNHQLFTIEADIRVASDHIDRDQHALGRAEQRTATLKEHPRQLRASAAALSR